MDKIGCRQFLLSRGKMLDLNWPSVEVYSGYTLFLHPEIEHFRVEFEGKVIHLVGELFDWKNPEWSNEDILLFLVKKSSKESFLETLSRFMGHYVLIYKSDNDFLLINDPCAQYEAYYSSDFLTVGSQVKLMERVLTSERHEDQEAIAFFESPAFKSQRTFVGDCTHVSNVRHLRPNHLIDLKNEEVERFFPIVKCAQRTVGDAATLASQMINGYVASIASRHKIAVAVTAGYDSRVLFLASLNHNADFYISQHSGMPDSDVDIEAGKKLANLMNMKFRVIKDLPRPTNWQDSDSNTSIDFPRYVNQFSEDFEKCVFLNGNCSEVARNYFGSFPYLSGDDLAKMLGYSNSPFAVRACRNWLSANKSMFRLAGYSAMDMFYWEEKMGNWGAKKRTETNAIGRVVYSPFNSRALFEVLLGTKKRYRDSHRNRLYDEILRKMHAKSLVYPINPTRKSRIIILLKKLGVYDYYRFVGFKLGLLRA